VLPPAVSEAALAYRRAETQLVFTAMQVLTAALNRGLASPTVWRDTVAVIAPQLLACQVAIAALADPYLDNVLAAQGASTAADAAVNAEGFADLTDGAGSLMRLLIFAPNSVPEAGRRLLASSIVLNGMHDTARSSVQAGMQARPAVQRYIRMLSPPSCSRCAILAGKVEHIGTAFQRHPRCDCINIPAAEDNEDWTTDPRQYFHSLSTEEQNRIFGVASARAIRDGANPAQVVNARDGMTVVRAFGRDIQITGVGTTKRAVFGGYEITPDGKFHQRPNSQLHKVKGHRYRTTIPPRLLPDEIYRLADEFGDDRAEVQRQLRRFGYLF
jgi:hypothetical protein